MNLSQHFSLEEMIATQHRGISNAPPEEVIDNLYRTAELLEDVRSLLGFPIIVTSGYRSPELNAAVGGVPNSAHITGRAADFICPGYGDPLAVCRAIERSGIVYDQLIFEYQDWTHIAWAEAPRMERWTYARGEPVRPGIVAT